MFTELMKETTKANVLVQSHICNLDLIVTPSSWTCQHSTRNRDAPAPPSWSCPEDVIHLSKISYRAAGHLDTLSRGWMSHQLGRTKNKWESSGCTLKGISASLLRLFSGLHFSTQKIICTQSCKTRKEQGSFLVSPQGHRSKTKSISRVQDVFI